MPQETSIRSHAFPAVSGMMVIGLLNCDSDSKRALLLFLVLGRSCRMQKNAHPLPNFYDIANMGAVMLPHTYSRLLRGFGRASVYWQNTG